jgi:hypothetical protein
MRGIGLICAIFSQPNPFAVLERHRTGSYYLCTKLRKNLLTFCLHTHLPLSIVTPHFTGRL